MSSNNNDADKKPLMYIVQPEYAKVKAQMQHIVKKKKKKAEPEKPIDRFEDHVQEIESHSGEIPEQLQTEAGKEAEEIKEDALSNQVESDGPFGGVLSETAGEQRNETKRSRKPLNHMNIEERIDFLTKLPSNIPKALCMVETEEKTYRGIILGKKDGTVMIRTSANGNPEEIQISNIKSIHPLGF